MPQHGNQRQDNVTALRIVRTHASQPKAILLRAVVKGKLALLQELLPLARGEAHRIAVAFQVEEQRGSIVVLPFAGVHRSAPQPDDDGDVLDSHRTLVLTGAAGSALERRLFGNVPVRTNVRWESSTSPSSSG